MFNKIMKLKYNFNPILHNRIILYFFFAIALIDLVYFLNIGDMYSFSVLLLVGILTSFFIKNMTVILFVALITTHLLKYGRSSFSEGMEGMNEVEDMDGIEGMDEIDDDSDETSDKVVSLEETSSKIKKFSKNIDNIIKKTENEQESELAKTMPEITATRDKIVQHVKNMQPLLEKFQGYIEKFNNKKTESYIGKEKYSNKK
jgi:hypothetical protein